MVRHKQKKNRKFRGKRGRGWGAGKKRRGWGSRGGKGFGGKGKKGKQKMTKYLNISNRPYGRKKGFRFRESRELEKPRVINLGQVQQNLEKWLLEGKIKKSGEVYEINLSELGYDKLLGSGKLDAKAKIVVGKAAKNVGEKLKESKSELILK